MNSREGDVFTAASMYYVHGETMEAIAHELDISRSSVSRLLKEARETGLVQITVASPSSSHTAVGQQISHAFGVACHVVPVREGASEVSRLERTGRAAAAVLVEAVTGAERLGIAWGTTLAAVVDALPQRHLPGLTIVQLNGSANPRGTGVPFVGGLLQQAADALGASVLPFPVPAFFDRVEARELLWQERSVRSVLHAQRTCDVAIFGVGTFSGPVLSQVYASGYLDRSQMAALREAGVVGDVCTVMLREDGSYADIPLNRHASGMTPREMASIPRRICVAAGRARVAPLLGALRAQAATDLVIDEDTARALVARAGL